MQPYETQSICDAVLRVLQYGALAPLAITATLAVWRAVADYVRGDNEAKASVGR